MCPEPAGRRCGAPKKLPFCSGVLRAPNSARRYCPVSASCARSPQGAGAVLLRNCLVCGHSRTTGYTHVRLQATSARSSRPLVRLPGNHATASEASLSREAGGVLAVRRNPPGSRQVGTVGRRRICEVPLRPRLGLAALVAISLSEVTCRPYRTEPRPLTGGRARDRPNPANFAYLSQISADFRRSQTRFRHLSPPSETHSRHTSKAQGKA